MFGHFIQVAASELWGLFKGSKPELYHENVISEAEIVLEDVTCAD